MAAAPESTSEKSAAGGRLEHNDASARALALLAQKAFMAARLIDELAEPPASPITVVTPAGSTEPPQAA